MKDEESSRPSANAGQAGADGAGSRGGVQRSSSRGVRAPDPLHATLLAGQYSRPRWSAEPAGRILLPGCELFTPMVPAVLQAPATY